MKYIFSILVFVFVLFAGAGLASACSAWGCGGAEDRASSAGDGSFWGNYYSGGYGSSYDSGYSSGGGGSGASYTGAAGNTDSTIRTVDYGFREDDIITRERILVGSSVAESEALFGIPGGLYLDVEHVCVRCGGGGEGNNNEGGGGFGGSGGSGGGSSGSIGGGSGSGGYWTKNCWSRGNGTGDQEEVCQDVWVPPSCSALNFCSGSALIHQASNCSQSLIENCSYACIAGACVPPPPPSFAPFVATHPNGDFGASGRLQARPSLLKKGDTTQLYWSVSNVSSCSIDGTNKDHWTLSSSGAAGITTGPIVAQTIYTLTCASLPGATPSSIHDSLIVNVVPIFNER